MNTENKNFPLDDEHMESHLWEYIDGLSADGDKTVIGQLILSSKQWKEKYNELLEVHQLMQASELEAPSMRFTKNVMEEISRLQIAPAAKNYIDKKVIWGIAIFFFTLIGVFIVYGLAQIDWSSTPAGSNSKISNYVNENLNKVDYSRYFNNTYITVFMMLNVILGLMLLDRYLANKRKQLTKEA
jgi:hypothetical protein